MQVEGLTKNEVPTRTISVCGKAPVVTPAALARPVIAGGAEVVHVRAELMDENPVDAVRDHRLETRVLHYRDGFEHDGHGYPRVHPFIEARPDLSVCQVKLDAARHDFLRRNSWIACHEVLKLRTEAVISELVSDMSRLRGTVHKDVLDEIAAAVKRAPTLSAAEQMLLAEALNPADD